MVHVLGAETFSVLSRNVHLGLEAYHEKNIYKNIYKHLMNVAFCGVKETETRTLGIASFKQRIYFISTVWGERLFFALTFFYRTKKSTNLHVT